MRTDTQVVIFLDSLCFETRKEKASFRQNGETIACFVINIVSTHFQQKQEVAPMKGLKNGQKVIITWLSLYFLARTLFSSRVGRS